MNKDCFDCQAEGQMCDSCVFETEVADYQAMREEMGH